MRSFFMTMSLGLSLCLSAGCDSDSGSTADAGSSSTSGTDNTASGAAKCSDTEAQNALTIAHECAATCEEVEECKTCGAGKAEGYTFTEACGTCILDVFGCVAQNCDDPCEVSAAECETCATSLCAAAIAVCTGGP